MSRQTVEYTLLDAAAATGVGNIALCEDFRHAVFSFANTGTATAKFQGAISDVSGSAPDFEASQSATNHWDYIEVVDLEDGTVIDGDTGVSTAAGYMLYEANVNGLKYITAIVTSYSDGAVTAKVRLFND